MVALDPPHGTFAAVNVVPENAIENVRFGLHCGQGCLPADSSRTASIGIIYHYSTRLIEEILLIGTAEFGSSMQPRRVQYLIAAVFIFALAGYELAMYTSVTSFQSTFNLQPNYTYDLPTTRNPSDAVTGSFQESSGNPVSFYIQTSAQFAAFQSHSSFDFLYSVVDVASGMVSYNFPSQDTYYILFRHGTGLVNTTETVYFQRNYQTHSSSRLVLGIIFVAGGVADLVLAFRPKKPKLVETPLSPSPPSTEPPK